MLVNTNQIKAAKIALPKFRPATSYAILLFFVILTLGMTYFLYAEVQDLFKARLQERISSIASTASAPFNAEELRGITGPESVGTPVYIKVVKQLQKIRSKNTDIKYIYILRRTPDPNTFVFVADADSLDPTAEVDLNNDGIFDESDELNTPGDPYDVSKFPWIKERALNEPTVDPELTVDQWGTFLSGSAPIQNDQGLADEFIGVDVDVSDYLRITNLALVPFMIFVGLLLIVLTIQTMILVRMWGSRVAFLDELDKQKDELLGLVSHQLLAPVTFIRWTMESFLDKEFGEITDEQEKELKNVYASNMGLLDLVDMILNVSRIQLGRMHATFAELKLKEFFHEILEQIELQAKQKNVHFTVSMPTNLPTVMLDKSFTHMTIENLLNNAVKYTPENGAVDFKVEIKNQTMYCTVKDTGCGIPRQDQSKIFGKLYRASNVANSIKGNGFGLYVAKGAIEAQGGQIRFESEEGKGTTFFVELPLTPAPVVAVAHKKDPRSN